MSSDSTALQSGTRLSRPSRLDVEVLEQLQEMLAFAGPDAIRDIFRLYLDDVPRRIDALEHALEHGDPEALRRAAHGLSGCSVSIGATTLAGLCQQLEDDPTDPAQKVAAIIRESDWVVRLVYAEIDRIEAEASLASTG